MLLIPIKESIEALSLKDSNYHYTPNIFILSCRHNKFAKQGRKRIERKRKRGFLLLDKVKAQVAKEGYVVNQEEEEISYEDNEDR